jgi:hypothetical protein
MVAGAVITSGAVWVAFNGFEWPRRTFTDQIAGVSLVLLLLYPITVLSIPQGVRRNNRVKSK